MIYKSPYKKKDKMIAHFYNTPRRGGHRKPLEKHLRLPELALLRKFPACRVAAGLWCKDFNGTNQLGVKVIEAAAEKIIRDWNRAKNDASKVDCDNPILSDPLCRLAMKSEHTVVTHSVGFHRDAFGRKTTTDSDCIENKIVLLSFSFRGVGRGGTEDFFEWALLDWEAPAAV